MSNKENDSLKKALLQAAEINKFVVETSEKTVNNILENAVKKGLKKYMTEAFEEEDPELDADVDNDIEGVEDTDSTEDGLDGVEIEEPETDDVDVDVDVEDDGAEMDLDDESGEDDDFDIEQFKSEDGEYDLTGADTEQLIKVFKRVDGNDSVSIIDLGDGKIELDDNETGAEYMIDTTGDDSGVDDFEDPEIEIELDDEPVSEQKRHSYEGTVTEEEPEVGPDAEGEGMVDEKNMTQSYGVNRRAGVLSQTRAANAPGANKRNGGQLVGESKEAKALKIAYNKKIASLNEQHEAFKKSTANEMKQLKSALGEFVGQLKENAVLNNSLGKFVKLIIENSTTKDEKAIILNRFATEANTIEDGNKLFETIQRELNGKTNLNQSIDKQFGAENSKVINEKVIYQNPEMLKMQDLMRKMDKY